MTFCIDRRSVKDMSDTPSVSRSDCCNYCGRGPFALTRSGNLYAHTWLGARCAGSGKRPDWSAPRVNVSNSTAEIDADWVIRNTCTGCRLGLDGKPVKTDAACAVHGESKTAAAKSRRE